MAGSRHLPARPAGQCLTVDGCTASLDTHDDYPPTRVSSHGGACAGDRQLRCSTIEEDTALSTACAPTLPANAYASLPPDSRKIPPRTRLSAEAWISAPSMEHRITHSTRHRLYSPRLPASRGPHTRRTAEASPHAAQTHYAILPRAHSPCAAFPTRPRSPFVVSPGGEEVRGRASLRCNCVHRRGVDSPRRRSCAVGAWAGLGMVGRRLHAPSLHLRRRIPRRARFQLGRTRGGTSETWTIRTGMCIALHSRTARRPHIPLVRRPPAAPYVRLDAELSRTAGVRRAQCGVGGWRADPSGRPRPSTSSARRPSPIPLGASIRARAGVTRRHPECVGRANADCRPVRAILA
ncbi:hypothetical protein C8R47DRAFT_1166152 [Mycena vitilis]|nr:hypothetical protein C8R47DRAFT_1166152 [Mycena vitilis]